MNPWVWLGIGAAVVVLGLAVGVRPLRGLLRLLARSGVGMAVLWLLQGAGGGLGLHLGVNLFNALVLGVLGVPGLGLLLMAQWVFR